MTWSLLSVSSLRLSCFKYSVSFTSLNFCIIISITELLRSLNSVRGRFSLLKQVVKFTEVWALSSESSNCLRLSCLPVKSQLPNYSCPGTHNRAGHPTCPCRHAHLGTLTPPLNSHCVFVQQTTGTYQNNKWTVLCLTLGLLMCPLSANNLCKHSPLKHHPSTDDTK